MTTKLKKPISIQEHIAILETRISRLEKLVVLAIITNLPQLLEIFGL
jgi:hypothetical protein